MKVPKLGNIWIGGQLVIFRDFTTGVPTPMPGFENWVLVSDVVCANSPILTGKTTGTALYTGTDDIVTGGTL